MTNSTRTGVAMATLFLEVPYVQGVRQRNVESAELAGGAWRAMVAGHLVDVGDI